MHRIVLLVEGDGDKLAVPVLLRRILAEQEVFNVEIASPAKVGDHRKLLRLAELEKHIRYADLKDGSAILVMLDCDDGCAASLAQEFHSRVAAMQPAIGKRFEVALLVREYETMFLWSLAALMERFSDYGWRAGALEHDRNWDLLRDAKGTLRGMFRSGRGYKELLDQPRLSSAIDFRRLREHCSSFRHLEKCLARLVS